MQNYNAKKFFKFTKNTPEMERYELINGKICLMPSNTVAHQCISGNLFCEIYDYLKIKKIGEIFPGRLDVVLFKKNKKKSQNVFQPDIIVIFDPKKISKKRINGAPEFVIEIVGESNSALDYFYKLFTYMKYGVKEYWIVNPVTKNILVYINGKEVKTASYTFDDKIKVSIFDDFEIDFKELQI